MATYAEMIYLALDELKLSSDDAYYTEEHIMRLLKDMRALLLNKKYNRVTRNAVQPVVSQENIQQICLTISPSEIETSGCEGRWLRSDEVIPDMIDIDGTVACTGHDLLPTMVTFIPAERMPNVGYNKWLRNIIYAAKSKDGHLYLHSNNAQFIYLELVGLSGIFSDPEKAELLSHDVVSKGVTGFNIMERNFPLESALVPECIELVVQELTGQRYAPEDKTNDAKDNLGEANLTNKAPVDSARRVARAGDNEE